MKRAVRIPILLLVAAACGDAPLTAPASGTGKVQVVTGQDQTGVVGSVLPAPVEVRVTSRSGSPLSEQIVYFKILKGGGSVSPTKAITDGAGRARASWKLGKVIGSNIMEVRAVNARNGRLIGAVRFEAKAVEAPAEPPPTEPTEPPAGTPTYVLVKLRGDAQTAPAGTTLPEDPVLEVRNAQGSIVQGVVVNWKVTAGGGKVRAPTSTTGRLGRADMGWTLGSSGPQTLEASVSGAAAPVIFTATVAGDTTSPGPVTPPPTDTTPKPVPVAKVSISPQGGSVQVGATLQLTATTRDAAGAVLSGRAVTWTSSNPAAATVSSSGLVKGVAAGSATITAASEGVSASVQVSVTAPPTNPPPPPPPPTNGAAFADDFEAGALAAGQNGYRWKNLGVNVSVAQGVAHSGRYALRFTYPGKPDCQDATAEQRFYLPNVKEVWLEYYFYIPAGTEGAGARFYHREQTGCSSRAHNNKFLRLWDVEGNYNNFHVKGGFSFDAVSGGGDSWLYGQWGDYNNVLLGGQDGGNWRPAFTDALRGRWTQIRVHAKLASSDGAADGVLQLWADGVLKIDKRGLSWHAGAGRNNFFATGYLMGWSNSGYTQTTSFFIDDFRIYQQNPGW